jgi:lysophospholipase L1-like esterase
VFINCCVPSLFHISNLFLIPCFFLPSSFLYHLITNTINNSLGAHCSVENAIAGVHAIIANLRSRSPSSHLIIAGLLPRLWRNKPKSYPNKLFDFKSNPFTKNILAINDELMKIAEQDGKWGGEKNRRIHYVDGFETFVCNDCQGEDAGSLVEKYMPDHLHPNNDGARLWLKNIHDKIVSLI